MEEKLSSETSRHSIKKLPFSTVYKGACPGIVSRVARKGSVSSNKNRFHIFNVTRGVIFLQISLVKYDVHFIYLMLAASSDSARPFLWSAWCCVTTRISKPMIRKILKILLFVLRFRYSIILLGAFVKLRKATISFVLSVCLSVCPHGKTRLPMNGF
jgi:hypothetical protein